MSVSLWTKAAACSLICAAAGPAQTTFGVIRGRVLDASGAAVPNTSVAVTNAATNSSKSVTSNESGLYEAGYLQPGAYSVSAAPAGFKTFTAQNVVLAANAVVLVDIRLDLGDISSSVTVEAGAPLITTETAVISDIKTQTQYLAAPLNMRGNWDSYVFTFMSMVPGVQPTANAYSISFAGTRPEDSEYTVDGISLKREQGGMVGPPVASMESIQEVKVDVSGNAAEFTSPSYVGVITKGGGNQVHGSVFYYSQQPGLGARDFFADRIGFDLLNDYGVNISGPVRRNKTFFAGTFEGFVQRYTAQLNNNMASERVRLGDFSRYSSGAPVVIRDPATNAPFANSMIPSNRLNATTLKIQERFFPRPNFGGPDSVVGNYRELIKQGRRREHVDVRADHHLSGSNVVFSRVTMLRMPLKELDSALPTVGFRNQRRQGRNFVISDTHTLRPNLINEFRFGMTRDYNPWQIEINGPQIVKELGLTNLPPELPNIPGIPAVAISGFRGISTLAYNVPEYEIFKWQDNLSWIRGRHTVKLGTEVSRYHSATWSVSPAGAFGDISFTGQFTGNAYADFLLGIPRNASLAVANFRREHRRLTSPHFFVQDDFKASPRLTINAGLRYEFRPPLQEQWYRLSSFDPWSKRLVVPQDSSTAQLNPAFVAAKLAPIVTASQAGLPERLVFTDKNNFGPRIGLAYKLTSDQKTVIRSAYGIFYSQFTPELVAGPYSGTVSAPPNTITNGRPLWQLPEMFPSGATVTGTATVAGIDPRVRIPYMQQWNLSLERVVGSMGLRASYLGLKTSKLVVARDVNQVVPGTVAFSTSRRPFPQFSTVTYRENGGTSVYHGLILSAERKLKSGLQYQVAYTRAKNLSDAVTPENSNNRRAERGNDTYTRHHRLVASAVWALPFGASSSSALRRLVEGWSVSTFVIVQTGQYFTPNFSGSDPANVGASGGRPDRIGSGKLSDATILRWFDVSAFAVPPVNAGRFGNSGVNILSGPGTQLVDLGLFKQIRLRERLRFRLEATFTNALNHPNFGVPRSSITSPGPGTITGTQSLEGAGARKVRLGMRMDF